MPPTFQPFKSIPRWSRDIIITEKIDGTNGVIYIGEDGEVVPGSRTRWLVNGADNFGFARWVYEHQNVLREKLGPGYHYGEWWGPGIQRGYGLKEKEFSLFNTTRWRQVDVSPCSVVPVLYQGPMAEKAIHECLDDLLRWGSVASPGFMRPEGIIIFHTASGALFKKTLEKDEGKGA